MRSRGSGHARQSGCIAVAVLLTIVLALGCEDDITEQDEVFRDAAQRVEENLLPPLVDESEAVLRNLLNLLSALPEVCATPLADMGIFASSLPALQRAQQREGDAMTLQDGDGRWVVTWREVLLGDDDGQSTVDTGVPGVDITLTTSFRGRDESTLRAIPFSLVPQGTLQTAGIPLSYGAGATEGFFLFQDAATGLWTLRWRALGDAKAFEGKITTSAVSRVVNRVDEGTEHVVTTLRVNDAAQEIGFNETTTATAQKGFTFFVRPGDPVRFQLRIGPVNGTLQGITREQLRIGALDQSLPAADNPADFTLASTLPVVPTGEPAVLPGAEVRTFIWQDLANNDCGAEDDQWRLRFSTQEAATTFSGTVQGIDDRAQAQLRTTPVGACPAGSLGDGGKLFTYVCTLEGETPSGYDLCVSRGRRLTLSPAVGDRRDPGLVSIGAARASPPAADPFTILFSIALMEQASRRELRVSNATVVLRGNNDQEGSVPLNPDQVSLEPLCSVSAEQVQPRVRLSGSGDYATARFTGSKFTIDNVEFTDANVSSLVDPQRFPDRGVVRLETQVNLENADVTATMAKIDTRGEPVRLPVDVALTATRVDFTFVDQLVDLTVE